MASPFVELEIGGRTVKVTNPDKVLFPDAGHTKRDLVDYYLAVGDGIVRALRERPTQLRRFPDGIAGEQIYQKRVPEKRPDWVEVARVTFPSGRHADELCVTEVAQVVWGANLAVIDFHPWPSRRSDVDRPDELRIDVDPQPGTTFADAKRVARAEFGNGLVLGQRVNGLALEGLDQVHRSFAFVSRRRAPEGGACDAPPWRSIRSGRRSRVSSIARSRRHAAIFA